MQPKTPSPNASPRWLRIWRTIRREALWPQDDRGRMRLAVNDLILHLHPPRVPAASIRLTYTWGLGGLAVLLIVILVLTGVLLMFAYTPAPDDAYQSIITLQTEVYFGQLIRNLHHWSGNALLVVSFLHLLRVFFTVAYQAPREFNWQLGLMLLALVALSNFTGYLLPWDQLSYWAVTVGSSLIGHVPLVGDTVRRLLLGGDTVNGSTLRNFFALHVIVIPLLTGLVLSFHIWRVRKDGISVPRGAKENGGDDASVVEEGLRPSPTRAAPPIRRPRTVTTIPHLTGIEMVYALVSLAVLLAWALFMDAPLGAAANPHQPPNPTKAAWYFMGVQELLLHFHPTVAVAIIPALTIGSLITLPYLHDDEDRAGVWFRSWRGRWLALLSTLLGVGATAGLVVWDEYALNLAGTFAGLPSGISNGIIPLLVLMTAVAGYGRLLRRWGASRGEVRLALFVLLLAVFLTLTVIGVHFRGEDMALGWPWEINA